MIISEEELKQLEQDWLNSGEVSYLDWLQKKVIAYRKLTKDYNFTVKTLVNQVEYYKNQYPENL